MHLQQHARGEPGVGQGRRDPDHGALDDVGGGALDRRIDRGPLAEPAARRVLLADRRHVDLAAEQRGDEARLAGLLAHAVHVVPDTGIALEVGVDIGLGLGPLDAEVVRQAEGRDAVDDAEVDRLGLAPDHGVHALDRHAEDLAGGDRVDVLALVEGLLQGRDVGDVGGEAQLDLAVVDREQRHARLGDEGLADLAPLLGADRDVLQVWVV